MSVQAHLGELAAKHRALEAELEDCMSHPASTDAEIAELKQERNADAEQVARVSKDITDTRAALSQAISDMRSGLQGDIAKINTKLDVRAQPAPKPSPPPPAPQKPGKQKPQ